MSKDDPVHIEEYSSEWPRRFVALGRRLRSTLGPVALRIDHIGSTAIPGLAAKPIIDVQVSVSRLSPEDDFKIPLEACGYVWREDNPDLTKRYFRESPGDQRTHIHVRQAGSWPEQFALLFRDYLRSAADERSLYEETKRRLAERFRHDRQAYTEGKEPVIWEIMQSATSWSQNTGWSAPVTDV